MVNSSTKIESSMEEQVPNVKWFLWCENSVLVNILWVFFLLAKNFSVLQRVAARIEFCFDFQLNYLAVLGLSSVTMAQSAQGGGECHRRGVVHTQLCHWHVWHGILPSVADTSFAKPG